MATSFFRTLSFNGTRWTIVLIGFLAILLGLTAAFQVQRQRTVSVLKSNLSFWEQEVTDAVIQKNWLALAKVGRTFVDPGVRLIRFRSGGRTYFSYPTEADEAACSGVYNFPVKNYGVNLGNIEVCFDQIQLLRVAAFSPIFLLSSLLISLLIFLSAIVPLTGYKRSFDRFIQLLTLWSVGKYHEFSDGNNQKANLGGLEDDPLVKKLIALVKKLLKQTADAEKRAAVAEVATQVAHDIRSPLAALSMLESDLTGLDEEKRLMVRSAVNRIKDIANNLLTQNRESRLDVDPMTSPRVVCSQGKQEQLSSQLVLGLIEPLLSEKRLQYRSKIGLELACSVDTSHYGLFCQVQPIELRRVISNIINNSIEALGDSGKVEIYLIGTPKQIQIVIWDNGKGIPTLIIEKIGQRGNTFGKTGGSGLGLYHARTTVESWGGDFRIDSREGFGTTVTLLLPRSEAPPWFRADLALEPNSTVVVLDDDTSIHQIWRRRFDSLEISNLGINVLHFSTPEEIQSWVKANRLCKILFLVDYELLGYQKTGLSLIAELEIASQSILVTSRYEESEIIKGCLRLGVQMIPKGMAGFVPIRIQKPMEFVNGVLLDDDELVHATWATVAKRSGKKLLTFEEPSSFFLALDRIDRSTAIFIDSNLKNGIKGQLLIPEIKELGFEKIYLTTGYAPDSFVGVAGLAGIVGKDPPKEIGGF